MKKKKNNSSIRLILKKLWFKKPAILNSKLFFLFLSIANYFRRAAFINTLYKFCLDCKKSMTKSNIQTCRIDWRGKIIHKFHPFLSIQYFCPMVTWYLSKNREVAPASNVISKYTHANPTGIVIRQNVDPLVFEE